MEDSEAGRYWCYQCSKMVNPILEEVEALTCPVCLTGFLELRESAVESGDASSPALSQILAAMLENLRELHSVVLEGRGPQGDLNGGENDLTLRSAVALLRTLRAIPTETPTEPLNPQGDNSDAENDENNGSSAAAAAIIQLLQNQVHETLTELPNPDEGTRGRNGQRQIGTFGDYVFGPNLDAIVELLTETDRNRYGTPPARKDVVAGLPDVRVEGGPYPNGSSGSCTVCFEEFRAGTVVKEMPCKHRFHSECILPWLDLHSSCPVCRHRLPAEEESEPEPDERDDGSRDDISSSSRRDGEEESDGSGGRRWVWGPFVWPF
ncbi:unnamed protein product [Cuscuta campestris]|uniref:RING-type E3 ubiquitin transferase n=1 Tax=Cuscuta campestris TaxID=132261 RepID=A0A484M0X9_9ASTE|nr:unnamed protein product [Cuscuta campestris]